MSRSIWVGLVAGCALVLALESHNVVVALGDHPFEDATGAAVGLDAVALDETHSLERVATRLPENEDV